MLSSNVLTRLRPLPCAIYLALVGFYSLQPQAEMPQNISDKIVHLTVYAGAALLWGWAAKNRRALLLAAPILIAYGVGLEIAQGFTPDRTPSALDALANSIGVVLGLSVFLLLQRSQLLRRLLLLPSHIDSRS